MKSEIPKVLHPVCGKPMVRHVVDALNGAGIDRVVTVASTDTEALIGDALGDAAEIVVQQQQLGTGHAVLSTRDALMDAGTIVVVNGDLPAIAFDTVSAQLTHHRDSDAVMTILVADIPSPAGEGRLIFDDAGTPRTIVEEADADEATLAINTINVGLYCFEASWLWPNLAKVQASDSGEYYLPDLIGLAYGDGQKTAAYNLTDITEAIGVNTRVQLAYVEQVIRERVRTRWMLDGVTMPDPATVYVDSSVTIGRDSVVMPNTHLLGKTTIGARATIGPNTVVTDSKIGDDCEVVASVVEESVLEESVEVGPYSHLRQGTYIESGVHVGNYVEVKQSRLGKGTKAGHFSYLGDADIGADVNIGAGTVTVNYDGVDKQPTKIGDGAFIGSGSMLVAPVTLGKNAWTGAGAVVTNDVPADTVAVGVPARHRSKRKDNSG